jgi:hypothetical protein
MLGMKGPKLGTPPISVTLADATGRGRLAMIRAVVTNGVIVPRAPLPEDWQEGTEVTVEKFTDSAEALATGMPQLAPLP